MEMLPRVSRISGHDYLQYFKNLGYNAFVIERGSGELAAIQSTEAFLDSYGPPTRIEDLAFLPQLISLVITISPDVVLHMIRRS